MTNVELPLTQPEISFTSAGGCEVRRTVHSSGLRILTERVPGSRSASIGLWIGAGSRDEQAGEFGSTHFLEHLLFKGTDSRTAFDISEAFDSVGAHHNALTAKESTCYLAKVRSVDLPMAVSVLADQVSNSVLRGEDFELERTVILEELAMAQDDPDDVCGELFFGAVFGDSALARPIGGSFADIEGAVRDTVVTHYRARYTPSDLVVTIAGDVDHDEAVALVCAALTGWDLSVPAAPRERRLDEDATVSNRSMLAVTQRDLEQVAVIMGVPGFRAGTRRRSDIGVLSSVLGGGSSSRLFQEIREKRGLAYSVDAFPVYYSDAGAFGMAAGCAPKAVAEVTQLMRDGLNQIAADGITEVELRRARGQILGGSTLALESTDSRMNRLGRAEFMGVYRDLDETERLLNLVTPDTVRAVAAELAEQPYTVSAVGDVTDATFAHLV